MIKGIVIKNIARGYERVISFLSLQEDKLLVAHSIQHSEYLDSENSSSVITRGKEYCFEISIKYVNSYSIHEKIEALEFEQPIQDSPAIVAKGKIIEVIDDDELLVFIPGLGESIRVEFEREADAKVGEFIVVEGQLEVETEI